MKTKLSLFVSVLFILAGSLNIYAQKFPVDTIVYHGPKTKDKCINIVLMSEGYTAAQLSKFISDAKTLTGNLFGITPFKEYANYFNVYAIRVPSFDSGANHPRTAKDCPPEAEHPRRKANTYFGVSFDYLPGSAGETVLGYFTAHRALLSTKEYTIDDVILNNFPMADIKVLLVNTKYDGGAAKLNDYCAFSIGNLSAETMAHEIGHTFGLLLDEYCETWLGIREAPNITNEGDRSKIKWKNWLGYNGVSNYSHCPDLTFAQWYRPHNSCKMRTNGNFCSVCSETLIERIHESFGNVIIDKYPAEDGVVLPCYSKHSTSLSVNTVDPIPNTLKYIWRINGKKAQEIPWVYTDRRSPKGITIYGDDMDTNFAYVTVEVIDTTILTRSDPHFQTPIHTYFTSWTVVKTTPIVALALKNPEKPSCNDGKAVAVVGGGTPPYRYFWKRYTSNINRCNGSNICNDLIEGKYFLEVIDSQGCESLHPFEMKCGVPGGPSTLRLSESLDEISAEAVEEMSIDVYPNPTTGMLTVFTPEENSRISVTNLLGEIIYSGISNQNQLNIDLSAHPPGIYSLHAETSTGKANKKTIIQK